MKFRKKPVVIEAIKWDGQNLSDVIKFMWGDKPCVLIKQEDSEDVESELFSYRGKNLFIKTPEGELHASVGDMIIKGVKGELYPCKPDIFQMTYDGINNGEVEYVIPKLPHLVIELDRQTNGTSFRTLGLTQHEALALLRQYEQYCVQFLLNNMKQTN